MSGFDPSSAKEFDPNSATEVAPAPTKAKPRFDPTAAPLPPTSLVKNPRGIAATVARNAGAAPGANTAFNDPNRKPAVNTTALDSAGAAQGQAIGNGITGALGLLQRPGDAIVAGTVHKPDSKTNMLQDMWGALSGSTDPQQIANNRAQMHTMLGGGNPVMNAALDIGLDPLTPLSMPVSKGRTLMGMATDAAEGHGLPLAVKAGQKIAASGPVGQKATDALSKVHDFMGVHSAAKRELAVNGPAWLDKYAQYRAKLMQMGNNDPSELLRPEIQNQLNTLQGPDRDTFINALSRADQGLPFASPLKKATPGPMTVQTAADVPKPPPIVKPTIPVPSKPVPTLADLVANRAPVAKTVVPPRPINMENVPQGPAVFNGDHNSPSFIAGNRGSRPMNWPLSQRPKPNITAKEVADLIAARKAASVGVDFGAADTLAPGAGGQMDLLGSLIKEKYGADTASVLGQPAGYKPPTGAYGHVDNPTQLDFMGKPVEEAAEALSPEQQMLQSSEPSLFEGTRQPVNFGGTGPKPTLGVTETPFERTAAIGGDKPKPAVLQSRLDEMVNHVAQRFGTPSDADQKIFDLMKQKKNFTTGENPLWNLISAPSDLMTAGIFAVPFGHMANISTLGALTDPLAVGGALARGTVNNTKNVLGRIGIGPGAETDAALAARHAPAQAGGAISSHAFERDNPLTGGLDAGAGALDQLATKAKTALPGPLGAIAAAPVQALAAIPKALSGLYKASGNVLWKFDDEVKAQRFQNLVDGGMDPQRAGLRVGGELVDYENKAPVAGFIRPIAPFATWRTKAPLAVGRNIIENPGKASTLQNQLPAAFGGDQGEDPQTGKPYTSSLPPAELNTLLTDPIKYGKSTASSPGLRLAGDLAAGAFEHGKRHGSGRADDTAMRKAMSQFTGGLSPLDYIASRIPGLSQYLEYSGTGPYGNGAPPSLQSDILSNLLVRPH